MEAPQIDLRGLPVWERPARVNDALDQLVPGETLTLVTENEPRGLTSHLTTSRKYRLVTSTRRMGATEWHIDYTRSRSNGESPLPLRILQCSVPFVDLPDDALARLIAACEIRTASRGQIVAAAGERWPHVGVVHEGTLALTNDGEHSRQRLYYEVFPYDVFGEAEFFVESPMLGRVIVLSKSASYLIIPDEVVREIAYEHPQFMMNLARVVAQRKRDALTSLGRQSTLSIIARIAQVLLPFSAAERGLSPAVDPLPHLTQSQIAASAGTVKEVAARAIAELERLELLKRERGHVRYLDRQKLADFIREQS